jgi:hypothetical protein
MFLAPPGRPLFAKRPIEAPTPQRAYPVLGRLVELGVRSMAESLAGRTARSLDAVGRRASQ